MNAFILCGWTLVSMLVAWRLGFSWGRDVGRDDALSGRYPGDD